MKKILLACLILQTQLRVAAEVVHHSTFDDNLVARDGQSWQGKNIGFSKGVSGKAVDLKGASYISFSHDLRFNNNEGTLELWLKTNWPGNDDKDHSILALGRTSGIRISKNETNELMFMWAPGKNHPQFGIKFSISTDWPAHEWRHLVITWNRDSFRVYVDGVIRVGGLAEQVPSPLSEATPFFLGCTAPAPGDLMVDELILRNNELTRAEVVQNYVLGMELLEQRGDPRLVMRALIGKIPATLILDTGSTLNVLFKPFAVEAGLKLMPSYRGSDVFNEETNATLTLIDGGKSKMRFIVLNNETGFEQQGMLGWAQFFAANRLQILWDYRTMKPLSELEMKTVTRGWQGYDFSSSIQKLMLPAVPLKIGNVEVTLPLEIDTGDGTGLSLTKKTWEAVLPKINQSRGSLSAAWTPKKGIQRFISMVPDEITLLGTRMHNISVCQNNHQRDVDAAPEQAIIGLAALSYFDVVIDGVAGKLWLKPRSNPAIHEDINLSGLLFEHDSTIDSKKHTTFVLAKSPAWNLGLRTGDEIIEVDGIQPDPNEMDPDYQIDVKRRLSHGDAIRLKVRRGEKMFDVIQTNAKN